MTYPSAEVRSIVAADRPTLKIDYNAQDKQIQLHESPANELLFGGAAGPGKSHGIRQEGVSWCVRIPRLQVYLFRRTYPELEENHIIPSFYSFPQAGGRYRDKHKRWEFPNGSMFNFRHCQYEKDVFVYQGSEIHLLLLDELTTFTEFIYLYLYGRVRCPLDIPEKYRHKIPGIVAASNPGNIGHQWVKERWVSYAKPYELKRGPRDPDNPKAEPFVRQYIPGLLEDNPLLMERDPGYIARLNNLPEPWRTAYKTGNWDIFMGQAFIFGQSHVITPMPIPDWAPLYMTFDWGFGAPYSIGWWWIDNDGRMIRFAELYGQMPGGEANTGTRETDPQIADKIIELEKRNGIWERHIDRIADPTCWNKKPDYKGGGQGVPTSEEFAAKGLTLRPGDPNRTLKIRQFQERIRIPRNGDGIDERPMLQVYDTCVNFIRIIPTLQSDEHNVEDIDTKMEDHPFDEACLLCMARPIQVTRDQLQKELDKRKHTEARKKLETPAQAAWAELDKIREEATEHGDDPDGEMI